MLFILVSWMKASIQLYRQFAYLSTPSSSVLDENFECPSLHSGHCCGKEVADSS